MPQDPLFSDSSFDGPALEQVRMLEQHRFERILNFTGLTRHDLATDPIARNRLLYWCRVSRAIDRELEVDALEQQWNAFGLLSHDPDR